MKINFKSIYGDSESVLESHAEWLANTESSGSAWIDIDRPSPKGYESYICIDVLGTEFRWLNDNFPKEKYTWYLWFESIFLVPQEMATFVALRWS